MYDIILDALKLISDEPTSIIYGISLFVLIWIYKELRSKYIESTKAEAIRVDEAIILYSEIDNVIYKYLNGFSDKHEVYEKISKAYSHLPYPLISLFLKSKDETDNEVFKNELIQFQKEIINEIKSLKLKQVDSISRRNENSLETIEQFVSNTLKPFFAPFFHLYIILMIIILLVVLAALTLSTDSNYAKAFYLSSSLAVFLYIISIYMITTFVIMRKKFPKGKIVRVSFAFFLAFPPAYMFLSTQWFRGLIILSFIFLYMIFIAKLANKVETT
jgi:ABC-type multidrug transport system fused ATPase/permease subunit